MLVYHVIGLRNPRRGGALSDDESLNGDAASIVSLNSDRGSYDDGELFSSV